MERIQKAKKFFTLKKIIGTFHVENEYDKKSKFITGAFTIIPKQETAISSVTFELFQTMQMEEVDTVVSLGKVITKKWGKVPAISGKRMEFNIPLSFSQSRKKQKKIYQGEMALMDRVHDESQEQRYSYEILATVKITGDSNQIDFSRKIFIK